MKAKLLKQIREIYCYHFEGDLIMVANNKIKDTESFKSILNFTNEMIHRFVGTNAYFRWCDRKSRIEQLNLYKQHKEKYHAGSK